ncbi:MAG: phosphonate ABC transporter ATP-binding protein [Alphaproteobacteria bacterium]|nr:phosphonate ABC transporter ATP-binding protein [Alphaproteobacteria bacterium]
MLKLEHVTKKFAEYRAVNDVSIEVPTGQMLGVVGRSGAGKSTLLRSINRLHDITDGSIVFDNGEAPIEVDKLKGRELLSWRAHCAMIFQQFNLVPRLNVITNVLMGRINYHGTIPSIFSRFSAEERAMAVRALDQLGVAEQCLQRADTLSGGQQQRVAIARALVQEPKIVLADEPISSLDPRNAQIVMDALRMINKERGITVIANLHTLDTAKMYCDRIIGMREGAIIFEGGPEDLTDDVARGIYGIGDDAEDEEFSTAITSTAIAG